jgi:fructose-1,6-bisphosphatase I
MTMLSDDQVITFEQFLVDHQGQDADGSFSKLLRDIVLAARVVNREVNRAGLVDILGSEGTTNVQGEEVQKLDRLAHQTFLNAMIQGRQVACAASEEDKALIQGNEDPEEGKYVVLFDPLDGSSNIDVNVSIGTIFAIYRRVTAGGPCTEEDCLQPGNQIQGAGYILYGSSTMLVFSTGDGVNAFTLDPGIGEFFLSHQNIQLPAKAKYYSVNESNYDDFFPGLKQYLHDIRERNYEGEANIKSRYIGSLVADFHRNLLKGGIFMYPGTMSNPEGKLRLLYEGNPMAFLAEQAGGSATDGSRRILAIQPAKLHQKTPLYVGSEQEIERLQKILAEKTGA